MSAGNKLFKTAVELKALADIDATREAQEKQLKILERQDRQQILERIEAREVAGRREEEENGTNKKIVQLAAVEKIHQDDLKIHHEQMTYVEQIALDEGIPLKQAADKFRQRLVDLGLSFYLIENRQSFSGEVDKLVMKYKITNADVKNTIRRTIEYFGSKETFFEALDRMSKKYREVEALNAKEDADKKAAAERRGKQKMRPLVYIIAPLALTFAWWLKPALLFVLGLFGINHH